MLLFTLVIGHRTSAVDTMGGKMATQKSEVLHLYAFMLFLPAVLTRPTSDTKCKTIGRTNKISFSCYIHNTEHVCDHRCL